MTDKFMQAVYILAACCVGVLIAACVLRKEPEVKVEVQPEVIIEEKEEEQEDNQPGLGEAILLNKIWGTPIF